jgi:hypothetical protein
MRFRLRTLLIVAAIVPPVLAGIWMANFVVTTFAACVVAALTVEATDALFRRWQGGRR